MISYALVASSLMLCTGFLAVSDWQGHPGFHQGLDVVAMFLAMGAGILLLHVFHTMRSDIALLVIGAGLLGTGILDGFHLSLTITELAIVLPSDSETLLVWSWLASRFYLGLIMLIAWFAWRRYQLMGVDNGINPLLVYIGSVTVIAISVFILVFIALPSINYPEQAMTNPWEWVPGVLLAVAFVLTLRKNIWANDVFEHWLVLSLVVQCIAQIAVMPFLSQNHDALFIWGHVLKVAGYLCLLLGVMNSRQTWLDDKFSVFNRLPEVSKATLYPGKVGAKLLFLITTLVMMSVGGLIASNIAQQSQQISQQVLQSIDGIAGSQKLAIQHIANEYIVHVRLIASREDIRRKLADVQKVTTPESLTKDYTRSIERDLEEIIVAETSIKNITLYNVTGHAVVSVGDLWIEMVNGATIEIPESEEIVGLSNVDGEYLAIIVAPVYLRNEVIGAIQVWIDAASIRSTLKSAYILGTTSESVLGYRNSMGDMTLISPHRTGSSENKLRQKEIISKGEPPLVQAYKGKEGLLDSGVIDYNGHSVYAALRHIPELHSGLMVKIDTAEIRRRVRASLEHDLILGFIILTLTLLAGWITAHMLMSPLTGLTRIARDLGQGHREISLQLHTNDEFGILAKTLVESSKRINAREVALDDERVRQRAVLDNMLDAVMRIDSQGKILYCNPACSKIFGYLKEELLAGNIKMLMGNPDASFQGRFLHSYLKLGQHTEDNQNAEDVVRHKKGHEIPVYLSVSRFKIDGQSMIAVIFHELTETRRFEKELKAQNQALLDANNELEQFAYITSHDLKSPLRAVDNLVKWICEDLQGFDLPDEVERNLGRLRERANTMEQMIQELLVYSRAGSNSCEMQEIDTYNLVNQIVYDLETQKFFEFDIDSYLPVIMTSKPALELVLRNLISNAVKHHDKTNGVIKVSADVLENTCVFCVCDDGPGIDPRFEGKVFQVFQTLQPKGKIKSTGMGLALVKRTIESCGGSIRMHSNVGVRGTCFEFRWPINHSTSTEGKTESEEIV